MANTRKTYKSNASNFYSRSGRYDFGGRLARGGDTEESID
jgi:hypothetical protein